MKNLMEAISFDLISNVGEARSLLMEALMLSREEDFETADNKVLEATKLLGNAHHSHFDLIKKENSSINNSIYYSNRNFSIYHLFHFRL